MSDPVKSKTKPVRLLELRSAWGSGGGPEKTILLSAARHDPKRVAAEVVYLRSPTDHAFASGIGAHARSHGVTIREVSDAKRIDFTCVTRLRRLAQTADVIHAHDYKTDIYGLLLARGGGHAKLVATAHGWTGESRKVRFYQWLDLKALRRYDRVIAVSRATRDVLIRGGVSAKKITVVHNAIDEQYWRPDNDAGDLRQELGLASEDLVIGTVARLSSEKGVDLLLEAVAKVTAELEKEGQPKPVFLIAGDGPEREDLVWMTKLRGIAPQVRFLGHRADVLRFLNTLDISVMPSRVENLPNALLEAMAVGKPCVAFNVGGVSELMGDAGLAVRALDREGLARAIVSLAADPAMRERLGKAARARIEKEFSFSHRLDRVESIYEELSRAPAPAVKAPAAAESQATLPAASGKTSVFRLEGSPILRRLKWALRSAPQPRA